MATEKDFRVKSSIEAPTSIKVGDAEITATGSAIVLPANSVISDGAGGTVSVEPDLTGYATETYVNNAVSGIDLSGYATTTALTNGLATKVNTSSIATVALTGNYNDLSNKPTIPSLTGYATETYVNNALALKADTSSLSTVATSGSYNDLSNQPSIPSLTSDLTNDSGFTTTSYVDTQISNLVGGAPGALDTLNELAAALNDDADFASSITNSLSSKADSIAVEPITIGTISSITSSIVQGISSYTAADMDAEGLFNTVWFPLDVLEFTDNSEGTLPAYTQLNSSLAVGKVVELQVLYGESASTILFKINSLDGGIYGFDISGLENGGQTFYWTAGESPNVINSAAVIDGWTGSALDAESFEANINYNPETNILSWNYFPESNEYTEFLNALQVGSTISIYTFAGKASFLINTVDLETSSLGVTQTASNDFFSFYMTETNAVTIAGPTSTTITSLNLTNINPDISVLPSGTDYWAKILLNNSDITSSLGDNFSSPTGTNDAYTSTSYDFTDFSAGDTLSYIPISTPILSFADENGATINAISYNNADSSYSYTGLPAQYISLIGTNITSSDATAHMLSTKNATNTTNSISIGTYSGVYGDNSVVLGQNARAGTSSSYIYDSVAIGQGAYVTKGNTIAIGRLSETHGLNSISLGKTQNYSANTLLITTEANGIYLSNSTYRSTIINPQQNPGSNTYDSVVIEGIANTGSSTSVIIGSGATAQVNASNCTIIGYGSNANADNSVAIGAYSNAQARRSTAVGRSAVTSERATAIGYDADAIGYSAIAIGSYSVTNGRNAIAIGPYAKATNGTVAFRHSFDANAQKLFLTFSSSQVTANGSPWYLSAGTTTTASTSFTAADYGIDLTYLTNSIGNVANYGGLFRGKAKINIFGGNGPSSTTTDVHCYEKDITIRWGYGSASVQPEWWMVYSSADWRYTDGAGQGWSSNIHIQSGQYLAATVTASNTSTYVSALISIELDYLGKSL